MTVPLPEEVGVIVLPNAVMFPRATLPLFIFEPRYQRMFELALEGSRVVAVGTLCEGGEDEGVHPMGGAGLIRACVRNPDGTSNLVLVGLGRVRFASWAQTQPYRVARIEPVRSRNGSGASSGQLERVVRDICAAFSREDLELPAPLKSAMEDIDDADALSDAVAALLVQDPEMRRLLFEELDVPARVRALMKFLRTQIDD